MIFYLRKLFFFVFKEPHPARRWSFHNGVEKEPRLLKVTPCRLVNTAEDLKHSNAIIFKVKKLGMSLKLTPQTSMNFVIKITPIKSRKRALRHIRPKWGQKTDPAPHTAQVRPENGPCATYGTSEARKRTLRHTRPKWGQQTDPAPHTAQVRPENGPCATYGPSEARKRVLRHIRPKWGQKTDPAPHTAQVRPAMTQL
jgi:hypothetical protein